MSDRTNQLRKDLDAIDHSTARQAPHRVAVFVTFGPSDAWTHSYAEEGCNRHLEVRRTLSAEVLI